jgi:GNT-I family
VVVFTTNDRPHYMARVLESWRHVRGIEAARLIFSCEPHPPMVDLLKTVDFAETLISVNHAQLGVETNPYKAEMLGFTVPGTDFVIQAEEDALVTTDLLEYMAWARDTYAADESVQAVCAYQNTQRGPLDTVFRREWFCACVWGTWRDRWEAMKDTWPAGPIPGGGSWDWWMINHVMKPAGRVVIEPCQSRSKNIGVAGVHGTHEAHMEAEWARQQFVADIPPQAYQERP